MSQTVFKNPVVTASPARTGTGTGAVQIDRLTHFTIPQTYTLTCLDKTPDTLFVVSGDKDGNVGIATVGTQFFDQDLKVFFTITQGATPFEVGDQFVFTVGSGTDLNQDNIDAYDELPQKNFGPGVRGFARGDDNLRYSDLAVKAEKFIGDLKYIAQTAGAAGNAITIEYADTVPAAAASLILQDLTYTALATGTGGNAINVQYLEYTPAQAARVTIQNLQYQAVAAGTGGNSITVAYTTGAIAGSEVVSVIGNAISVQIQSGVSTAAQVASAIAAFPAAAALVSTAFKPAPANSTTPQTAPVSATHLIGGSNAIGDAGFEVVSVTGSSITVTLQSGASTATQVRTAVLAYGPAAALVSVAISGTGSNFQSSFVTAQNLTGGTNIKGPAGAEVVEVTGSAIKVFLENGVSTATQVRTAVLAYGPAAALVDVQISGYGAHAVAAPRAATSLLGGLNKFFAFNHDELSDAGNFVEGNGSIKAKDATLSGKVEVSGHTHIADVLSLKDPDTANASGAAIPNVQKKVNDIQAELTAHETATSGVHGVTGNVVGTTDAQTLTNKTIDDDLTFKEISTPGSLPGSGYLQFYPKNDGKFYQRDSAGVEILVAGSGTGGAIRIMFHDPVSTTLPSGASATVDGVSLLNNDLVLFTNLGTGNNKIYKATGVGTSIVWTPQTLFAAGASPSSGEQVIPTKGNAFAFSTGVFDGSTFLFNDKMRFFNGIDYWELSNLKTQTLSASSTGNVFTITAAGSENMMVDYSIVRGATKETGTVVISVLGTAVSSAVTGTFTGSTGVVLDADYSAGNVRLRYTADGSAGSATIKFFVRRWSDSAGGPAGLPSYSSGVTSISAAGSDTQVQFNDSGNLGADADFTWDKTANRLQLSGLNIYGLSSTVLTDNSSGIAFQYNATSFPFAVVEYSIKRDSSFVVGRLMIVSDGTSVSLTEDVNTLGAASGVTLSASIVSGNIQINYVCSNTGFNAQFKFSARKWA